MLGSMECYSGQLYGQPADTSVEAADSLVVNVNQKPTHCDGEKPTHSGVISGLPERASSP
jgi:hypothetical protein